MKNIEPLFQSKAGRFIRKISKPIKKYISEFPESNIAKHTESFIMKGTKSVSPARQLMFKYGRR